MIMMVKASFGQVFAKSNMTVSYSLENHCLFDSQVDLLIITFKQVGQKSRNTHFNIG